MASRTTKSSTRQESRNDRNQKAAAAPDKDKKESAPAPPENAADQMAKLEKELHGVLGEIFDLRQEGRTREIREMERQLERQRAVQSERASQREAIIQRRFDEMTGRADALAW